MQARQHQRLFFFLLKDCYGKKIEWTFCWSAFRCQRVFFGVFLLFENLSSLMGNKLMEKFGQLKMCWGRKVWWWWQKKMRASRTTVLGWFDCWLVAILVNLLFSSSIFFFFLNVCHPRTWASKCMCMQCVYRRKSLFWNDCECHTLFIGEKAYSEMIVNAILYL